MRMAPTRTPPTQAPAVDTKTAEFNAAYISWRKLLQRANATRIKTLRSLEKDGSTMAAELLGEKTQI